MNDRSYSELITLDSFEERFRYLELSAQIGFETFGSSRYLNQLLYTSKEWRRVRDEVIIRDDGCDLGLEDYPISGPIRVHHMNPITKEQVISGDPSIFNPEFLISSSLMVHNAIHFGKYEELQMEFIERRPNDTIPWR